MKKISERLYVIEDGVYADRLPDGRWRISDEQENLIDGPFSSLQELQANLEDYADIEAELDAADPDAMDVKRPGDPGFLVYNGQNFEANEARDGTIETADLVTLSEAAKFLPVTRQTIQTARRRGTLNVDPKVVGRTTTLYSLSELKARYPHEKA